MGLKMVDGTFLIRNWHPYTLGALCHGTGCTPLELALPLRVEACSVYKLYTKTNVDTVVSILFYFVVLMHTIKVVSKFFYRWHTEAAEVSYMKFTIHDRYPENFNIFKKLL
jgi:hypothetical protein